MAQRRPDLELIEVNPGFNYLAERIFPILNKTQKTGKFYSQDMPADQAAQTGRTLGNAPTTGSSHIAVPVTYTNGERIRREKTPKSEIELFGGLNSAEVRMTKVGKRAILRSRETAIVTNTVHNTDITQTDILGSLLAATDVAIDAVHRFQGRLVAVGSWTAFRRMTRFTEVTNTLLRNNPQMESAAEVRNVKPLQLADILGVEEFFVGDDAQWPADRFMIYKEPVGDVDPQEEAQLGRITQYDPDDGSNLVVESYFEDDDISYKVQAITWDEFHVLNTDAAYTLIGLDEGQAITTSTTSTTT